MQVVDPDHRRALRPGTVRTVTFEHEHGRTSLRAEVLSVTAHTVFVGDATKLYAEIPLASIVTVD